MPENVIDAIFMTTWFVLMIGGFVLFYLGGNAEFKRKWFPRYVILGGILFLGFTTAMMARMMNVAELIGMWLFMVPTICLISWLNIRMTKFCDGCGKTISNQNWFSRIRFCPNCGSGLESKPKPKTSDDLLD
jgi:hypothetical protein